MPTPKLLWYECCLYFTWVRLTALPHCSSRWAQIAVLLWKKHLLPVVVADCWILQCFRPDKAVGTRTRVRALGHYFPLRYSRIHSRFPTISHRVPGLDVLMGPQPTALLLWSARMSAPQLPYLQTKYSCENTSSQQLLQIHTSHFKGLHCFLLVSHSSFHCITLFTNQELSRTYFCQTLRKNVIPLATSSKIVHYFFTHFLLFFFNINSGTENKTCQTDEN